MRYSDAYLLSKDIDWFININGIYMHFASAGGLLPDVVNDREKLRMIQHQVSQLPDLFQEEAMEIQTNSNFISFLLDKRDSEESYTQYLASFAHFARKGFISFDRTEINNPFSNHYHAVCSPVPLGDPPASFWDLPESFIHSLHSLENIPHIEVPMDWLHNLYSQQQHQLRDVVEMLNEFYQR